MLRKIVAAALLGVSFSASAGAAWQKVSSPHFIIYADESPERLREFAARLERFDKAVRLVRSMSDPKIGDGHRLTGFVVPDGKDGQRLAGRDHSMTKDLAGFYRPSATGSIAVVPKRSGDSGKPALEDQETFFHEYAHHLMFADSASPTPLWYSEGFAEFMSTASFAKDGSVTLGRVATGRALDVSDSKTFPLDRMLSGKHAQLSEAEWSSLYARGWLLTHYLTFDPTRKGQLQRYLRDIGKGVDSATASAAFGDLAALDRNLKGYVSRRRLSAVKVGGEALRIGAIAVEPLTAGASEVMPFLMQARAGVTKAELPALAQQVRSAAARHPTDAFVQVLLAGIELQSQQYAAAEAAADRALAANPGSIEAMIHKGRAVMERASLDEKGKTFADARSWFQKANRLDTEDPEPLMYFYEASIRDRGRPSANAIAALHYASDLAPQDYGLRTQSAYQYLESGKLAEARRALVPIAFAPHSDSFARNAQLALGRIDAGDAKGAQAAMRGRGQ